MSEVIVAFFNPRRKVDGQAALPGAVLPKAWTGANGVALCVLEKPPCHGDKVDLRLVVFDDAKAIPEGWVGLIQALDAVTLIWHHGSTLHKKAKFDAFLEAGENCVEGTRRATQNDFEFHHESGDETFVDIKHLLEGKLEPQAFIDNFSRAGALRRIRDAACLVQLQRIANEPEHWKETVELVSRCLAQAQGEKRAKRWRELDLAAPRAVVVGAIDSALGWLKSEYEQTERGIEGASRASS